MILKTKTNDNNNNNNTGEVDINDGKVCGHLSSWAYVETLWLHVDWQYLSPLYSLRFFDAELRVIVGRSQVTYSRTNVVLSELLAPKNAELESILSGAVQVFFTWGAGPSWIDAPP